MVVVGHSFGGAVALNLAAARPDLVSRRWCCSTRRSAWTATGCARSPTTCSPRRTTPTAPRRAPRRRTGRGARSTRAELDRELDEHLVDAARRAGRLADQHPGDDVVLERAGPAGHVAAQWVLRTTLVRATRTEARRTSTDELRRSARAAPRGRFHTAGVGLRPHGPAGQARRDGGVDPRAARAIAMAPITDEQVETVRALVASIPPGRVSTYGDIAEAARSFQPAHRRLDHAHRFVGSAVAPGDPGVRSACAAPEHATTRTIARRRRARRRRPDPAARGTPRVLAI